MVWPKIALSALRCPNRAAQLDLPWPASASALSSRPVFCAAAIRQIASARSFSIGRECSEREAWRSCREGQQQEREQG